MLARLKQGGFVRVRLDEDALVSGYLAEDPGTPGQLRLDTYLLSESGHLQQATLDLVPEDIRQVQFLTEAPEFFDTEGQSILMSPSFF
jgi:hypothetical protein